MFAKQKKASSRGCFKGLQWFDDVVWTSKLIADPACILSIIWWRRSIAAWMVGAQRTSWTRQLLCSVLQAAKIAKSFRMQKGHALLLGSGVTCEHVPGLVQDHGRKTVRAQRVCADAQAKLHKQVVLSAWLQNLKRCDAYMIDDSMMHWCCLVVLNCYWLSQGLDWERMEKRVFHVKLIFC